MDRRTFLLGAAAAMGIEDRTSWGASLPIIDTHVHLYDPKRPQGVPWPSKEQAGIYRTFLPADYRKIAEPCGVVGMIALECSPWVEDNYWVLDIAARDTIVAGVIGNLHPGTPDFGKHLERLRTNPLFRGIRFGDLWGRKLADEIPKPECIGDLRTLAEAGLTLDTVGGASLPAHVVQITDRVPDLRVILDHLPSVRPPEEKAARAAYDGALRELGSRPQVYAKISAVFRRVGNGGGNARVPHDLGFYRSTLEAICGVFGEERVLFGSNWTASEPLGTFAETVNLVREFFAGKPRQAAEKCFRKNSVAAYRWVERRPGQRHASNR